MPHEDEQAVRVAVVLAQLVREHLGACVRAARNERRGLVLRRRRGAEHLARRRLVKARLRIQARVAHRLQQTQRPQADRRGGVLGHVEAHAHVALRAQVVDLVRPYGLQHAPERAAVVEIAVVQAQAIVRRVRVLVDGLEPLGVEGAGTTENAVNLVPFAQQQLGQIGTVLPGDAGDERSLHPSVLASFLASARGDSATAVCAPASISCWCAS